MDTIRALSLKGYGRGQKSVGHPGIAKGWEGAVSSGMLALLAKGLWFLFSELQTNNTKYYKQIYK